MRSGKCPKCGCDRIGTGFPRLRVGVKGEKMWDDLSIYVLAPFEPEEQDQATAAISSAADAAQSAVVDGVAAAAGGQEALGHGEHDTEELLSAMSHGGLRARETPPRSRPASHRSRLE